MVNKSRSSETSKPSPAKKSESAPRRASRRKGSHEGRIPIEGVMLHARAIIMQGRTQEFLTACKSAGYNDVRGSADLVAFVQNFIASPAASPKSTVAAAVVEPDKFTMAVRRKTRNDDTCGT